MNSLSIYDNAFSDPQYNVHSNDEFRYLFALKSLKYIVGCKTLLDLGSGRGTLIELITSQFPNIQVSSADLNNYHCLPAIPFIKIDLNNIDKPLGKFEAITCMDVLEHLDKNNIDHTLKEIALSSKYFICSIANHSDVKNGVELHTIQEDSTYWKGLFKDKFEVVVEEDHYHHNGKPRLHLYVLQSLFN